MKKTTACILLSFLFLSSCSKHIPSIFEVEGFSLSNSINTLEEPFDAGNDSVPQNAYAIKMTLNEVMKDATPGDANENGFKNEDQVTYLNIYSLTSFDGTHLAGASLNDYFLTDLSSTSTIPEFISKGKIGQGKIVDNNTVANWTSDQYFFLMHSPAVTGNHSFVINMTMSDGRQMSDTVTVRLY